MNYKEEIINAFVGVCKRARKEGYAEGLKRGEDIEQANAAETKKEVARLNYEQGLNDMWECARKIFVPVNKGGLSGDEVIQIFNSRAPYEIFDNYSALEAITKIKEYEENQKQTDDEIHVGDEIERIDGEYNKGRRYIVTRVTTDEDDYINVLFNDGEVGYVNPTHYGKYKKTGRSFPQIEEVLKQMKKK